MEYGGKAKEWREEDTSANQATNDIVVQQFSRWMGGISNGWNRH